MRDDYPGHIDEQIDRLCNPPLFERILVGVILTITAPFWGPAVLLAMLIDWIEGGK
jgi:hypothetical protein